MAQEISTKQLIKKLPTVLCGLLLLVNLSLVSSFPLLFNRPRLFHQPAAKQQQQQPAQQFKPNENLMASNSIMLQSSMGAHQYLPQPDLVRLSAEHLQVHQNQPQLGYLPGAMNYFGPHQEAELLGLRHQPGSQAELASLHGGDAQATRVEPLQSEIVDKIERHIGQQIERSLAVKGQIAGHAASAASGYYEPERAKKEAAASGESAASHEESAEYSNEKQATGKESAAEQDEEPVKRHHQESAEEQHEQHEHHEHPPEAFEVEHKKGGKSFQYFHQGHHH